LSPSDASFLVSRLFLDGFYHLFTPKLVAKSQGARKGTPLLYTIR